MGITGREWREGGARFDALFDRLAQALNSNEQFGTGRKGGTKPGHPTFETLTKKKTSVIRIRNKDELCCARALVVAKARLDQHPKQKAICQGRPLQRTLALQLHHEAHVPLGPCGYDALTKFSTAPSLVGYQILLVDAHRSFHITTFGDTQDKQLILLHEKGHYDVITHLRGFSDLVTCVPTVGNPITQRERIGAANEKTFVGPVAKKPAPISWRLTHGVSKPRDVVVSAIVTFSETGVTKPIAPKTIRANQRPVPRPLFAFVDVAVPSVSNRRWETKLFNGINAGTWIVLPAASTWTAKPTVVSFKEPALLKNFASRKRNANARVKEVLAPNEGWPRGFQPMKQRRKTWATTSWTTCHPCTCFLTLKPCNPKNSTSPICSLPKPKTTTTPCVSEASIASEIFSNGWIPSR